MKKKYSEKPIIVDLDDIDIVDIQNILNTYGKIRIKGLGDFSLKKINGRIGWNPKEKKKMKIDPYFKVKFKPDKQFKSYFN